MSLPDCDYATSATAIRMLQMVTAGFYDNSRIGQWIFEIMGRELDEAQSWATELHLELFPQTCTWSVGWWEYLYGITSDESLSLELRRQQIMAKVLYRAPINPETIRRGVSALTACEDVVLADFVAPYTFHITVTHSDPVPNMTEVWEYIYSIKPSHLSFRLFFAYVSPVAHQLHPGLNQAQITKKVIPEITEITQADVLAEQKERDT